MAPLDDSEEIELRDYLAVLRRRKWSVLVSVAVVVLAAVAVSLVQTPVYEASAEVLLQPRSSEEIFSPDADQTQFRVDQTRVNNAVAVMKSRSVREAVAAELGKEPEVTIRPQEVSDVVTISAESTDPAEAANVATTYAQTYIASRRQALIDDLLAASEEVQAKVGDIAVQIDELDAAIADVDRRIGAADLASERQALQAERQRLEEDNATVRATLQNQRNAYAEQLDRLQLARNLTQTGGAQLVSAAAEPTTPVRPKPVRNAVLALVVGLMLGVAVAFLREHLDDTVKGKDDLDRVLPGVTVLGLIPAVAGWKDRATPRVVSVTDPTSHVAEAYRSLRTSVQFLSLDDPLRIIQLTSPNASEGKTTTLANLAVALSRAGQRVVVVCCDLRRPRVHEFFGLDNAVGFTSVLLGEAPLSAALQQVSGEHLALLASGPPPPNPSELLASKRTADLLTALRRECDVVLVDSPPVLPVTDAMVLSRMVDATILVGTAGQTTRREYQRSLEMLQQVEANLVGTVLNGVEQGGGYGYGYGYGYRQPGKVDPAQVRTTPVNGRKLSGNGKSGGAGAVPKPASGRERPAERR
ncbi:MAG TPA: polysaccharide biosynthesis tyrosine autokinase [Acidimicrobiales bacterium]|nr:polysaccharide biosynthesis tyrosine autokinase [Acidimicrobiales bacterium]